jgi:hypothetical protein
MMKGKHNPGPIQVHLLTAPACMCVLSSHKLFGEEEEI